MSRHPDDLKARQYTNLRGLGNLIWAELRAEPTGCRDMPAPVSGLICFGGFAFDQHGIKSAAISPQHCKYQLADVDVVAALG